MPTAIGEASVVTLAEKNSFVGAEDEVQVDARAVAGHGMPSRTVVHAGLRREMR